MYKTGKIRYGTKLHEINLIIQNILHFTQYFVKILMIMKSEKIYAIMRLFKHFECIKYNNYAIRILEKF
ncbi:hypothetical protein TCEA9_00600 [Thermobrachium celere]|nr:hypothetical protein TCEA9_00600 [Thermobrachium celere]